MHERSFTSIPNVDRHGDIPWLPKLSALGERGASLGRGVFPGGSNSRGGAKGLLQDERFETLGVNEGDSSDIKKVRGFTLYLLIGSC